MFRRLSFRHGAHLAALTALAVGLAGPALAQSNDAATPPAAQAEKPDRADRADKPDRAAQKAAKTEQAAAPTCTPGAFGEGVDLDVEKGDDGAIKTLGVAFQCSETLSDGTFIPEGYRVYLSGDCADGPCAYPTMLALPTAREGQYEAFFVENGMNVTLRIRKVRGRVVVTYIGREPGDRGKPTRAVYEFRDNS